MYPYNYILVDTMQIVLLIGLLCITNLCISDLEFCFFSKVILLICIYSYEVRKLYPNKFVQVI